MTQSKYTYSELMSTLRLPLTILIMLLFSSIYCFGQMLQNGPMVGYSATREAMVWVQTKVLATVQLRYWAKQTPTDLLYSQEVTTMADHGFTAHLVADRLDPGTIYEYDIIVNGQMQKVLHSQQFKSQPLWKWRTDAPNVKFVAGSCFYVNEARFDRPEKPYGGDYNILQSIYKDQPEFMIWLGDNAYLRESDWDSRSGVYHRYTHSRKVEELRPLLANTHHYAIWDDHDYGPNDSDRTYYGKHWTLDAFKDFWANPVYGVNGLEGITGSFTWSDADFFLMDNRWYRSIQNANGQILGKEQMTYLLDALQYSTATFKFVCIGGQVLNTVAKFENYAVFADERNQLLQAIDSLKIKGVIFLDGDRHMSEMAQWKGKNGITIYDITSSSLTSGVANNQGEANENRIKGSSILQKNYALIEIVGPKGKRAVNVNFKDTAGASIFQYSIPE